MVGGTASTGGTAVIIPALLHVPPGYLPQNKREGFSFFILA